METNASMGCQHGLIDQRAVHAYDRIMQLSNGSHQDWESLWPQGTRKLSSELLLYTFTGDQ
jgi:hypothetical protein